MCGELVLGQGQVRVLIDLASGSVPEGAALIEPPKYIPELYQRRPKTTLTHVCLGLC